jgi:hypothetical protein
MSSLNLSNACSLRYQKDKISAAIFILTQNNPIRLAYLKTTLYFLFKNFNATSDGYRYPVHILHEGDFDLRTQHEVVAGIRENCRKGINFIQISESDFRIPEDIDIERLKKCIAERPVPYWRNERYRMMCRWWLVHFPKYTSSFDYVMRLDDDSIIEEPVPDMIAYASRESLNYVYNIAHLDCGFCCLGLRELFLEIFPDKYSQIDRLFVYQTLKVGDSAYEKLENLRMASGIRLPYSYRLDKKLSLPIMFYNNFFIMKTSFWRDSRVVDVVERIDRERGIFYHRWGDSPIQSIIVNLLSDPNKIFKYDFKYSKRMQREAFVDDFGEIFSYVGRGYI